MKSYTAWKLSGDWWWVGHYVATTTNGKAEWEDATATKGGTGSRVLLRRIDDKSLREIHAYVAPSLRMKLKKLKEHRL